MTSLPEWLRQLREIEIVNAVQRDPRSMGSSILGYTLEEAVQAIGGGQTCFDKPWRDLSPRDRVLIYCYLNQVGHIEELTEAFGQIYAKGPPDEEPVVIDLGCGPFTGGLALASVLGSQMGFHYVGMDQSETMRAFGESLAEAATRSFGESMPPVRRYWTDDLLACVWPFAPGWRPIIVIASYLLASRTLRVTKLVGDLGKFLNKVGRGEVTVMYTNSDRDDRNRNYPQFRDRLQELGFDEVVYDHGRIRAERTRRYRRLRYGLFYRPRRTTLPLEEVK